MDPREMKIDSDLSRTLLCVKILTEYCTKIRGFKGSGCEECFFKKESCGCPFWKNKGNPVFVEEYQKWLDSNL